MIRRLLTCRAKSGLYRFRVQALGEQGVSLTNRARRALKPGVWQLEDRCVLSVSIIGLGSPPASGGFTPTALNDNDQVIGSPDNGEPYLYNGGTWAQYLFLNEASYSFVALNNVADAAGSYSLGGSAIYGLRFADGKASPLSPTDVNPYVRGGGLYYGGSTAYALDNSGDAVGEAHGYPIDPQTFEIDGDYQQHATIWPDGQQNPTFLPVPGSSWAYGINDAGEIVGTYNNSSGAATPFLLDGSDLTNLPDLPNTTGDTPVAINNNSWIIGTVGSSGVLWKPGSTSGSYTAIPLDFAPVGINNNNIVAGGDGTLWSVHTGDVNVNSQLPPESGWVLNSIAGINNSNDLAGVGSQGAYLLTGLTLDALPTIAAATPSYDTSDGGVNYGYTISGADLRQATTVDLDWASGTAVDTVIGDPIVSTPTETAQGTYDLHATPAQLGAPPSGANYLLVVADPDNLISTADPSKDAALAISDISAV
jgi:hypothetical protein